MKTPQPEKAVVSLDQQAQNIDELSKAAMEAFASPESFVKELSVASAVQRMREALTPDVMQHVMALMNTSIGFDTDRNPAKAKQGENLPPYSVEVVKDVFIESRLRGFHVIGKEFTIISGNFYAGVNGLQRLVRTHPKVANFKDIYEVPRMSGDKGALVKCKATWNQEGTSQDLETEFAIRVNAGQGADAILGKAKRKLMAAVLSRLTGIVTPEGDADDAPLAPAKPAAPAAQELFPGAEKPADNLPMDGKTPLAK